jgi:hypothetical protein
VRRNARLFDAFGSATSTVVEKIGEHMRRMFLLSATIAGSLFASAGAAQAAASCEAMLKSFDAQLSAKGIATTDERVAQARSQAQESCATGNLAAAQSSLNRAGANIGFPPSFGSATGGDAGATEAGGSQSQAGQSGASSQNGEATQNGNASQNAGINGSQNGGTNATQNAGSNNSGSGSNQSANANSGNQNGSGTNSGTRTGQTANASSGDQNSNGSGSNNNSSGSNKSSGGNQSGTQ